ncbi:acylphosphatase [Sphingomonas sp. HF-S3]|uniref:acylphosphatase n=1 Tax=Sphingomonas rustica TaxID=3103142 RepID=A0ABV0BA46_9SPHN
MATQRIFVSGRVQGVTYRDWTVRTAKKFGLTGWVRNLSDGRVEILADGEEEAIGQLVEACREGPTMARVDNVSAVHDTDKPVKGFTKRFTASV